VPPSDSPDAYHVGPSQGRQKFASSLPRHLFQKKLPFSTPDSKNTFPQSKFKRFFSTAGIDSPGSDVRLDGYRELDTKKDEFFTFLDKELDKIETFYKMKEDEASDRLLILRDQLHELRDQRMEDIRASEQSKEDRHESLLGGLLHAIPLPTATHKDHGMANGNGQGILKPIEDAVRRKSHIGKTSMAMEHLASPTHPAPKRNEHKSDYTRRTHPHEHVAYRFAKRRLKLALQEFYRSLELLKSYALLNRTGFRKINKKYDKAVQARLTGRYMMEKVNKAHFVQSHIIESHLVAVEDLYARYFERGSHKLAVGKLRTKHPPVDHSNSSFHNGLFVAAGAICGIQGLIGGAQHLASSNPTLSAQSNYLLQIYAGYFLINALFLLFVLNCMVWTAARINYVFVFEYDTRHVLDWHQLGELPCFFLFLNGLFLWLNFREDANGNVVDPMFLYYPIFLIATTVIVLFLPLPVFYHNARKWWAYSNWRLLLAGLYPVEFRDFYLGDMYCSVTYSLSQLEVFFCLYVHDWQDPPQCNSSHSRLLGFLTTLPAIWRALQCLRRYYDSRNWFPHLANFSKYCGNILYYMTLSMYRIHMSSKMRAVFIGFAAVNSIYCSFWDVAMDFSLGNPWATYPFLRDQLGYRRVWVYYLAAAADVVLRQQWVFYAIFAPNYPYGALLSFGVGLAEVLRRGMWSLFRVENEHCNNVGKFRASRDIPLPYSLPGSEEISPMDSHKSDGSPGQGQGHDGANSAATGIDLERDATETRSGDSSLRQRKSGLQGPSASSTPGIRALQRVGSVIAAAHAQDFTKKNPHDAPGRGKGTPGGHILHHGKHYSSDESDGDGDGTDLDTDTEAAALEEADEDLMEAQKMLSRGQG
jgi:xenotropic and polytropic retrovirus receptor 1